MTTELRLPASGDSRWLRLTRNLPACVGEWPVAVLDLCEEGALIQISSNVVFASEVSLQLQWQGRHLTFLCRPLRIREKAGSLRSGDGVAEWEVAFRRTPAHFQELIASYRDAIERAQTANQAGEFEGNRIESDRTLADLGNARRETTGGFIRCSFSRGQWERSLTTDPAQPDNGFTLASFEDESQILRLQLAYEESGPEERALIREFASLSLSMLPAQR